MKTTLCLWEIAAELVKVAKMSNDVSKAFLEIKKIKFIQEFARSFMNLELTDATAQKVSSLL